LSPQSVDILYLLKLRHLVIQGKERQKVGSKTAEVSVTFTGHYKARSPTKSRHKNLNASCSFIEVEEYP